MGDNVSIIIPIYLLMALTITQFKRNFHYLAHAMTDKKSPNALNKIASVSRMEAFDEFSRTATLGHEDDMNNHAPVDHNDSTPGIISSACGWILCSSIIFYL